MRAALLLPLVASLMLLGGCVDVACSSLAQWGLSVQVTGADTGQPIAATVIVRDGDYVEELVVVGDRHVGAAERPGTYRLEITADGYTSRVVDGVEVDDGGCHVDTERFTVALEEL